MRAVTLPTFYDEVYEAAIHLPVGARLILPDVDWADYERWSTRSKENDSCVLPTIAERWRS